MFFVPCWWIICFICTVYDSYYTLLVCVWDGGFVKGRDSHEIHQIVCALILCVTG